MRSDCTLTCSHTAVQFVDAASSWPDHVSSVTDDLRLSVPASVDKLNPKDFSIHSLPLYGELMASCSSLPRFEPHASTTPVTDILDTVLFFVAKLRALQASASENDRVMQSVVLSLFDVLGSLCSDKILLIDGPSFLLPRSLPPQNLQRLGFEGRALLFMCVVLDETLPEEDKDDESLPSYIERESSLSETSESCTLSSPVSHTSSVAYTSSEVEIQESDLHLDNSSCNGSEEQDAHRNHDCTLSDVEVESDSEKCDNFHVGLNSDIELSSECHGSSAEEIDQPNCNASAALLRPIDIPDAHILPGRGLRTACLLPAVCVADEDNINALVTSIACQQHALGISLPVLGFCLYRSSESLLARLVVAWVDGLVERCQIPSVRLATADAVSTNSPSFGVFDLLNPLSAVLLSQFVLCLPPHVDALSSGHDTSARGGNTHWRADQTDLCSWSSSDCCLRPVSTNSEIGSIESWVESISMPVNSSKKQAGRPSKPTNSTVQRTLVVSMSAVSIPSRNARAHKWLLASDFSRSRSSSQNHSPAQPGTVRRNANPSRSQPSGGSPQSDLRLALAINKSNAESVSAAFSSEPVSKLAKKDKESLEWLVMRGTMLLSATAPEEFSDIWTEAPRLAISQIEPNVEIYKTITGMPDWPRNWIDGTGIELGFDTAYSRLRTKFIHELQQLSPKGQEGGKETLPTSATILSDDQIGFQVLSCRFSAFLAAVAVACSYDNNWRRNLSLIEAETPRPWDNILDIACSQEDGSTLNANPLLEYTVSLPKNTVDKKSLGDFLLLYEFIAISQFRMLHPGKNLLAGKNLKSYASYAFKFRRSRKPHPGNGIQTLSVTAKADAVVNPSFNFETATDEHSKPLQFLQLISPMKALLNSALRTEPEPIQSARLSPSPPGVPDTCIESNLRLITLTFVAKYKKNGETLNQAMNHCCFYLAASLTFLKSLGVVNTAVYGVVGWGSTGTILMAWNDSHTGYNFILREATVQYDLTDPLDAFKFGMSIHRIFREQLRLVDKLGAHREHADLFGLS